jgi:hypothetical protein
MLEFLAELLLQLGSEGGGHLLQTAWHKLTGREHKVTPTGEVVWSIASGVLMAGFTLLFFPHLALRLPWQQVLNLMLAPLLAGLLVERWRAWRESRAGFAWPVFGHAALFGVCFAGTRWLFGM